MSDFDPGEGWREVPQAQALRAKTDTVCFDGLSRKRYWVREEPVPPLPTEPYTVIRVTWEHVVMDGAGTVLLLNQAGLWQIDTDRYTVADVRRSITGFEVLAEPMVPNKYGERAEVIRRETAKAVLTSVGAAVREQIAKAWSAPDLAQVAREFGVDA